MSFLDGPVRTYVYKEPKDLGYFDDVGFVKLHNQKVVRIDILSIRDVHYGSSEVVATLVEASLKVKVINHSPFSYKFRKKLGLKIDYIERDFLISNDSDVEDSIYLHKFLKIEDIYKTYANANIGKNRCELVDKILNYQLFITDFKNANDIKAA